MLQTQTVEGTTLELLKRLMQDKNLSQFNLAGGTALALYIGHRMSIDHFEDINFSEPILMLKGKFNWKNIEKRLQEMIKKDKPED